jgi:small subunit ribosomal protein S18
MSDELNPTQPGETSATGEAPVTDKAPVEIVVPVVPVVSLRDQVIEPDAESEDAIDAEEFDDDEEQVYGAPAQYVESEGGRTSRIGSGVRIADVDYKNVALLSRFLDRRGRILSRRKTRVSARVQRRVTQAIKRARHLALLPYTADQTRVVRKRR